QISVHRINVGNRESARACPTNLLYREQTQFLRAQHPVQTKHSMLVDGIPLASVNWLCLGLFSPRIGFQLASARPKARKLISERNDPNHGKLRTRCRRRKLLLLTNE